jgi:putative ABC transport system substrate-binding protein
MAPIQGPRNSASRPITPPRSCQCRRAARCALVRTIGRDRLATPQVQPHKSALAVTGQRRRIAAPQLKELQKGAQSRGWRFRLFDVRKRDDIEQAFAALDNSSDAVIVGLDALTQAHRGLIADLAARGRLPAIYGGREFVEAGGLIFYGPSFPDIYRRAATYVDRIFKGAKPADLPVEQPTKFEMMINLRAAKAIGLEVPPLLQQRADELIE